jgi:hypothetical protein
MKTYNVYADYSNRAGVSMRSGPYESRNKAEDAAVAMTAKGYETVRITTTETEDIDDSED